MEWHVSNRHFKNGYGWIFPHKNTVSIGAYSPQIKTSAKDLKTGLLAWAKTQGFSLESEHARADCINYDYQGWRFGRTFLVGDAAGLASGLTGEGIYPAIVSGEEAARSILDLGYKSIIMQDLLRRHRLHKRMAGWTGSSPVFNAITGELVTLGLRFGVIGFNKLEMAN
jgi:geranylgeranyl reductase